MARSRWTWAAISTGRASPSRLLGIESLVAAAVVATLLAIFLQDPLTRETLSIEPEGDGNRYLSYSFDDRDEGGRSTANIRSPLDWTCTLSDAYRYKYCGFGLVVAGAEKGVGRDLSQFETMKLKLDYDGRAEYLRIVLKNHDESYGLAGKPAADKPNQATIAVASAERSVPLKQSDFTVAEWWKDLTGFRGERSRPEFGNVTAIEFVTGAVAYAGEHRIRVRGVTFEWRTVSNKVWYGTIVACWILLIGGLLCQRRLQAAYHKRHLAQELRTTLDSIPQVVWTYGADGTAHFNRRWEDLTGVALGRNPGANPWSIIHADDRGHVMAAWNHALCSGENYEFEFRIRHRSGDYRWVLAQAVQRQDESGATWYGTCTDVHDRVLAERALKDSVTNERAKSRQLKWASEHDALTGLPNRRAFQSRLRAATLRAMESNGQVGLLLIDIDHFKHVNDSFGHIAGDDLLKSIAKRLTGAVREGDFVARIGGDEFAILVESVGSAGDLLSVANAAFASIQAPLKLCRRVMSAGASIGGAIFPRDASTANDLFKNADTALYALKSSGRGGSLLFHGHMLQEAEKAASQLAVARVAVTEASIIPFYQAKVALASGAVEGFEALLRWRHPTKGLQLPDTLEEAFKDYELAARIGDLMQRNVAADIRSWIDGGIPFGRVSINAAPAEFLRDDYAERLLAVLAEQRVPPEAVEVEVTEHAFMERGRDFVARALAALQRAGVTVSLDDFGTGSSSLSHLRDFPVDRVKIDKSFVQQMTGDPEIAAIVAAVVNLARSLSIDVVGEGVETRPQLDLLRSMGCHLAQGHLFWAAVASASVPAIATVQQAA